MRIFYVAADIAKSSFDGAYWADRSLNLGKYPNQAEGYEAFGQAVGEAKSRARGRASPLGARADQWLRVGAGALRLRPGLAGEQARPVEATSVGQRGGLPGQDRPRGCAHAGRVRRPHATTRPSLTRRRSARTGLPATAVGRAGQAHPHGGESPRHRPGQARHVAAGGRRPRTDHCPVTTAARGARKAGQPRTCDATPT